jgi:hypothetical protein
MLLTCMHSHASSQRGRHSLPFLSSTAAACVLPQYLMGPAPPADAPAVERFCFQPRKNVSIRVASALIIAPAMTVRASAWAAPCMPIMISRVEVTQQQTPCCRGMRQLDSSWSCSWAAIYGHASMQRPCRLFEALRKHATVPTLTLLQQQAHHHPPAHWLNTYLCEVGG